MQQNKQEKKAGEVSYLANGQDISLNYDMVRKHLVKGEGDVTDTELLTFISICKYNGLNPFLNEAYLVKFKGANTTAQMIVSKEALMKRAESSENFEGLRAGIIVQRGDDILELEGTFKLKNDTLLGGWAEVLRKDRRTPYKMTVSMDDYNKGQSIWKDKSSTMIRKTAIVQALREAFPSQLGAMYTAEEKGIQDTEYIDVSQEVISEKAEKANKEVLSINTKEPFVEEEKKEIKAPF